MLEYLVPVGRTVWEGVRGVVLLEEVSLGGQDVRFQKTLKPSF